MFPRDLLRKSQKLPSKLLNLLQTVWMGGFFYFFTGLCIFIIAIVQAM